MSNALNRQWLIVKRPEGLPGPENFEYVETPVPTPDEVEEPRLKTSMTPSVVPPPKVSWGRVLPAVG